MTSPVRHLLAHQDMLDLILHMKSGFDRVSLSAPLCRRSKLAPTHIGSAAVAVVAWVITATRSRRSKRHGRLLLHRLLHQEPDGSWTWRVRGAKVPATRTTDVSLLIEPTAAAHYCPDCLLGALLWDAAGYVPRALECRGLWKSVRPRMLENRACRAMSGAAARLPVAG